MHTLSLYFLDT